MNIRPASTADTDSIMEILAEAADFMHNNGNPTQWTGGYPGRERISEDINRGWSYVAEEPDGKVVATFCLMPSPEPTYSAIIDGDWLSNTPYHVIHRMACANRRNGIATQCMEWCKQHDTHLRADTHRDNIPMQNLLRHTGFTKCGIIYLADGAERIAFEWQAPEL